MPDSILAPNEQLTADQVAALLLEAGFTPEQAAQMTAISKQESGFNAGILNDTPATGDYSVGLFQVNYYGNLAQSRTAEFGPPSSLAADPLAQAQAAKTLFNQAGYSPWASDFNNGTAQANLPLGVQAVNDVQSGHITVGQVQADTAGYGYVTGGASYQTAPSTFGKLLQQLDAFYNPSVTLVPGWTSFLDFGTSSVANSVTKTAVTVIDRIVGVFIGAGLVYIGVKLFTGGDAGGGRYGVVPTAIRGGAQIMTGRELSASRTAVAASRERVAGQAAQSRNAALAQRAAEADARVAAEAVRAQQRAAEHDRRSRADEARNRVNEQRARTAEQAEARRRAEHSRENRRKRERSS